jgi:hypothetical protein
MRYVILRDDDTNAFTPPECLEQIYRPFLDRGLPVNLAAIPDVSTNAKPPGSDQLEQFLFAKNGTSDATRSIGESQSLVQYLKANRGYHLVQHGCHHDCFEFDRPSREQIVQRLEAGSKCFLEAGFSQPETFVAPHDKLSRTAYKEVARRFKVISTGWFELRRLPQAWWPNYAIRKLSHAPHWQINGTLLLSHPGCLLSYTRNYNSMMDEIVRQISSRRLTVLVTHWWEYFRNGHADTRFISVLHETAEYLKNHPEFKVISFAELAQTPAAIFTN